MLMKCHHRCALLATLYALTLLVTASTAEAAPLWRWRPWRARSQRPLARRSRGAAPQLEVKLLRSKAVLEHHGGDKRAADHVVRLLNNAKAMQHELTPVPLDRFDVSQHGSRGLSATSAELPGRILRITGLGVVKASSRDNKLTITPPQQKTKLTGVDHLREMGTSFIARDGSIWGVGNDSPYGAYKLADVRRKADNTRRMTGPDDIKLVAAGRYRGTKMGWLAYSIPADAQAPHTIFNKDPRLYQQVMGALGSRLRKLHDGGVVHLQMHPGNWFVRFEGNKPRPIISDWATAQRVDALPHAAGLQRKVNARRGTSLEQAFRDLPTKQRAFALDLYRTLSRSVAPEHSVAIGGMGLSDKQVAQRIGTVIETLAGYHGWKLTQQQRSTMLSNMTSGYRALALHQLEAGGGMEPGIHTYQDLATRAHFGGYAQKSAMTELYLRVARASRQDASALRRDLAGANTIISAR